MTDPDSTCECGHVLDECSALNEELSANANAGQFAEGKAERLADLVDDLANVLSRTVVGWEPVIGHDLSQAPEVQRVMARYRAFRESTGD